MAALPAVLAVLGDVAPTVIGILVPALIDPLPQIVQTGIDVILASDTDIDAQTYQQMRGKSYQEVLRTNGQISFPEVLRQQSRL